jgi:hypothetical protein
MSEITAHRNEQALKLVERLIEHAPDAGMRKRLMKLRGPLKVPIQAILDKVPGESVIQKAKAIGVTRQAIYGWLDGLCRPNPKQARKIAKITGFSVADVRGRDDA